MLIILSTKCLLHNHFVSITYTQVHHITLHSTAAAARPSQAAMSDASDDELGNDTPLDYEAQRQINIQRNRQQLASLNIAKLPLPVPTKRKPSSAVKRKPVQVLEPTRRSSRVAGIAAAADNDIVNNIKELQNVVYERIARQSGPLQAADVCSKWAYDSDSEAVAESDLVLDVYKSFNKLGLNGTPVKQDNTSASKRRTKAKPEPADNTAVEHPYVTAHAPTAQQWFRVADKLTLATPPYKLLRKRIMTLQYHPQSTAQRSLLACCDRNGAVALLSYTNETEPTMQTRYDIHLGLPTTGAVFRPNTYELYSSSQHGDIRRLDLETKVFNEVYLHTVDGSEYSITTMAFNNTGNQLYCADKHGLLAMVDPRGDVSQQAKHLQLHDKKIATVQCNPVDSNYFATGSNDRTMAVWDVRKCAKQSDRLYEHEHGMAVTGVQWSYTGKYLATTSYDCYVRVFKAADTAYTSDSTVYSMTDPKKWLKQPLQIAHNNRTGRWVTAFKPVWLHNDAGIVIGNMTRAVDLLLFDNDDSASQTKQKQAASLGLSAPRLVEVRNENVTSIPASNAVHPQTTHIASMTASGYIMFWRPPESKSSKVKVEK